MRPGALPGVLPGMGDPVLPADDSTGVDLHAHSHCSDGRLSPAQLVERAAAAGVRMLALTDHDTTEGLAAARAAADGLRLTLVDGVEISACWRSQGVHVLGLWIDPDATALQRGLSGQATLRRERIAEMGARLDRLRLPGTELAATVLAAPGVVTRTHLAAAMVGAGLVKHAAEAFHRYLGQGKPAYRRAQWPDLGQVIEWIRGAGGHAVLAHPMRYRLSGGARRRLIADFAAGGGTALEVVSGSNPGQAMLAAAELARQFGLAGTVGSDFHDPNLSWNPLGRLAKLPHCIEPLWTRAAQHQ